VTVLLAQATGLAAGFTTEVVLFVVFSGLAIGAGIAMVSLRNVVHAALMLVINMMSLAGLYLVLESAFLSVIQVIVYAGAVMVLFLFVIMLLGVDRDDLLVEVRIGTRAAAVASGLVVVAILAYGLVGPYTSAASICPGQDGAEPEAAAAGSVACVGFADTLSDLEGDGGGSVEIIATPLFTRWSFPFEMAALLLTVATIGAMLLGRRTDVDPDVDPAWAPSMVLPEVGPDDDVDERADTGEVAEQRSDEEPVPASVGPVAATDPTDDATGDTHAGEEA